MNNDATTLERWRLVLGRFARKQLPCGGLSQQQQRMEAALDYLYSREYRGRGLREEMPSGGDEASQFTIPTWLSEVRELFPQETVEVIEKHALERYEMTELVTDAEALSKLEPNLDLLKTLLSFRGHLKGEVLDQARRIIRHVVEEIRKRWESEVRQALGGKLNRFRHSPLKAAQNFDWRTTLRRNLKHYNPERKAVVLHEQKFFARNTRHLSWDVILCVDQSGSMGDSLIHSAVMAGIFAGLPSLSVKLVVFDTAVVDLSEHAADPVEVLMSVQLGGGTDIARALGYCEKLVEQPRRTVLVLVSDFIEGGSASNMLATVKRMKESGVTLLGLAALNAEAMPVHDPQMAQRLANAGMEVAALTPKQLAGWLARITSLK
ncbi:MAG: VWA domain-containing protein [Verrucomicrobiota bacterium]